MSGLELSGVDVARGGMPIVRGCALDAPAGAVTVLLGRNGSGKSTLLDAISGRLAAARGSIRLEGRELTELSRTRRARLGLAHVEQGRTVFPRLTAWENVLVAAREREDADEALAAFPELRPRRDVPADRLSGGEQQMVVIARALARRPSAVVVDELSLGLAPGIVRSIVPSLRRLAHAGVAVLVVEQFTGIALELGDQAYVMRDGEVCLHASCDEVAADPERLRRAYLGA